MSEVKKICACGKEDCMICNGSLCLRRHCCRGGITKILAAIMITGSLGYIGYGLKHMVSANAPNDRFISVQASAEKEIRADYVIWRIPFQNTGNDLKLLHEKFIKDRDAIVAFLKEKGFDEKDLSIGAPRITDQFVRKEYGDDGAVREDARYVVYSRVKVSTKNVDAVIAAEKDVEKLVKLGLTIPTERHSGANPKYFLHDTLKVEQIVYDEALMKGVELAKQVASKMDVRLGSLRQSSQAGPVRVLGQNHEEWGERLKGPIKVARVDVEFKFNIQ